MTATYSTPDNFKQPVLQWDRDKRDFVLTVDYVFTWTKSGIERQIRIPAGFDFDKASVPRPLWGIARPDGPWEAAALIHDALYLYKGKLPVSWYQVKVGGVWRLGGPWTRGQADDMLEWMGVLGGASKWEAWKYKTAVRLWPGNWFKF